MNFSESFSNYSPYYDYDVYSSWQLIFEDYSFSGNMFSDYGNEGQSYIFIPLDAPIGVYDLKVYDFGAESYQILEDIFTITLAQSQP